MSALTALHLQVHQQSKTAQHSTDKLQANTIQTILATTQIQATKQNSHYVEGECAVQVLSMINSMMQAQSAVEQTS
jgi:uncharacterized protein YqeY